MSCSCLAHHAQPHQEQQKKTSLRSVRCALPTPNLARGFSKTSRWLRHEVHVLQQVKNSFLHELGCSDGIPTHQSIYGSLHVLSCCCCKTRSSSSMFASLSRSSLAFLSAKFLLSCACRSLFLEVFDCLFGRNPFHTAALCSLPLAFLSCTH